jgi:histidine triad (HIT) family protein
MHSNSYRNAGRSGTIAPTTRRRVDYRDCIFCKIVSGAIPSKKAYEDEKVLAFYDLNPQAPVHVLVIPKVHIAGADEITDGNAGAVADVFAAIPKIAGLLGLKNGYRVVNNCGPDAHQSVRHLHFHLLAGMDLGEQIV